MSQNTLNTAKRVIIKVGSALVVDQQTGQPRSDWLKTLAQDVKALKASGVECVIVSSGAIALARQELANEDGKFDLGMKQLAAALGQTRLMAAYKEAFQEDVPQILLTADELDRTESITNIRRTFNAAAKLGFVPIVNENDTTATDEIKFGDNDMLAARLAYVLEADTLVILSRTGGLYTGDPETDKDAKHIPMVQGRISKEMRGYAAGTTNALSTGGMESKLNAASICMNSGIKVIVAQGGVENPLAALTEGRSIATAFIPA